ncbi:MAG TPA: HupE/UreJ family protein [Saprospiraceae bacterium]|nr:HupE/UreJ family protein [Saprospiraceae bacterium]
MSRELDSINRKKLSLLILISGLFIIPGSAHTVVAELAHMSKTDAALLYLQLGYKHILPLGFDHILFVLSLYLLSPRLKSVIWQASAFTVAHTITLGLAMYNVIKPIPSIIEPVIAISIMYVAFENIFSTKLKTSRIGIVFLFGLVHGMGFASVLGELGLPKDAFLSCLLMFNVGVELGQITVILAAYVLLGIYFSKKPYYHKAIVVPISLIIIGIAFYWTIERIFY